MENEIQEILTKLKNNDFERDCNDGSAFKEINLSTIETLLDYITNLEQENKKLKSELDNVNISKDNYIKLINQVGEFTERIDKAIEHIEESLYILKGDGDIPIATSNVRNRYIKPLLKILKGE